MLAFSLFFLLYSPTLQKRIYQTCNTLIPPSYTLMVAIVLNTSPNSWISVSVLVFCGGVVVHEYRH